MDTSDILKFIEEQMAKLGALPEADKERIKMAVLEVITNGKTIMDVMKIPAPQMELLYELALSAYNAGDYSTAQGFCYHLHEVNPRDARFTFAAGSAAYKQQKLFEALKLYLMSAKIDPSNPATWFNVGDCHFQLSNLSEAADALNRAIEAAGVHPNHTKVKQDAVNLLSVVNHYLEEESDVEKESLHA